MKKIIYVMAICLVAFMSCKKENNSEKTINKDCETKNIGFITFTNLSSDPYMLYIDDILKGTIPGKSASEVEVKVGTRTYKLTQVSGYVFYPTEISKSQTVTQCADYSIPFPEKK